jgi:signal transduction histidine kinase
VAQIVVLLLDYERSLSQALVMARRSGSSIRATNKQQQAGSGGAVTNDLVDDLAHQLSQPLAAIVSYARGCQIRASKNELDPQDLVRALDSIADEALRAGELLKKLRATMEVP